jgi:hypothetical protein|tara:strand:+ start:13246 stop:13761 length:516 start_codon:yes stop_codon:yes gene_type:complete
MSRESTPTLSAAIKQVFEVLLAEQLHTCMPGIITEYDGKQRRATVQPQIKKAYLDGEDLEYKPITDIPVVSFNAGNAGIRLPEDQHKNQTCLLVFSERALDNWLLKDGVQPPNDPRKFDITDGIAIVGLNNFVNEDEGGNDMSMYYNGSSIKILENGDVDINDGNLVVKAP